MEQAWREIPHIFNMQDIDATQLVAARASLNDEMAADGIKMSYMPFLVGACVLALKAHPSFNASVNTERDEIIYRHRYNVGIATATGDGLMVPVLHDADQLSLGEVAREIAILADVARTRKASVAQLSHGRLRFQISERTAPASACRSSDRQKLPLPVSGEFMRQLWPRTVYPSFGRYCR